MNDFKIRYVIQHKENKTYYVRQAFKDQKHFSKDIKEARKMTLKIAKNILSKFNNKDSFEIKEVKIWR